MENSTTLLNWTKESKEKIKYDFSCELYRMSTYSAFPAGVPISERSLARAGFYYTGVNDKVKCFCCGLMLDNWKQGDSPVEKHRQLYPSCSFVQTLLPGGLQYPPKVTAPVRSGFVRSLPLEQGGSYSSSSSDPLHSRAVEDCPSRTSPCSYAMTTEEARFLTYSAWPLSFLSPAELARAGFYYIGPGDRVACFACGGKLSNWEPKDDAMSEHRRHFPNCPFLENSSETQRFSVSNLSMQTHTARMRTFLYWPSSVPVQPEQLASAGFYYMDRNDDVKCFCCDGGLRCWESGDDPWVEHAKWFPRCEFLIRMKGQEFVDEIQARYPHLLEQLLSTSDTPGEENDLPIVHFGPGESSEDAVMMNTPVVKAALEMGFSRSLVRQTVQQQILATGENYRTVSDIVSALVSAEGERREEKDRQTEEAASGDLQLIRKNRMALFQQLTCVLPILDNLLEASVITKQEHDIIRQKTQIPLQARELIDTILVKGNAAANIFKTCLKEIDSTLYENLFVEKNMKYIPAEDVSGLSLEEQLRRLQEERTCKVCMDREVSIVFIPCGHLVVCQECAPSLRKCPICRGTIKGTVRTFLS
ncbi:baculoviral IAP repeat-containing protein 2 [Chionomys nivalis]|uniref:baculoviral IAP repeat-containing protein 2 n=1 Tax=Chionomys nivalis TaxID=269649 RepID=UPI002596CF93|nr:baculoviral IAP repeat-containing protein 2 [Chionomys nivalis]XP_057622986.1 baculoviral IAP repeat-containing protein 2 [Chionomys nivalis]XP_057622987.1 baculoviral IAP repeat-containing protein 2 [Chionomys nivalis]XP_057622988.1 baculoviral IAP repeat-containing protein 2 [Chionomys nivalis]XP_057622989.1 baculoviral IAP repeat-containing protein 2 [Chionomys nivalis]XP_057622990.1 baculoviral IAP repeat-containing protein 2 [Chionomys nivalis]XP_057622991.1 baculoviral IAP repeat-con